MMVGACLYCGATEVTKTVLALLKLEINPYLNLSPMLPILFRTYPQSEEDQGIITMASLFFNQKSFST